MILGIDTSNYTTSVALTDENGNILLDKRTPLVVKQGERGLRQSHALFQHMENLPLLLSEVLKEPLRSQIKAIAVSSRPRPVEGSYMPVFKAGMQFGNVLSNALAVPCYMFSHQEGHLAAAAHNTLINDETSYFAYHLSGGTCELLDVNEQEISIIGGSNDISFGQLIDRFGVAMDLAFPAGKAMDEIALTQWEKQDQTKPSNQLKPIPIKELYLNLSGIETQALRILQSVDAKDKQEVQNALVLELFLKISDSLEKLTKAALKHQHKKQVLFTGGVSASTFLRKRLLDAFSNDKIDLFFGEPKLSSDNAVGISLLGGKALWH
ncbi:MAG: hypothetical protein VB095_12405 [Anaerovorax sp.]|nr:hypothetical protein [Anaerovorax sp.]